MRTRRKRVKKSVWRSLYTLDVQLECRRAKALALSQAALFQSGAVQGSYCCAGGARGCTGSTENGRAGVVPLVAFRGRDALETAMANRVEGRNGAIWSTATFIVD